MDIGLVRKGMSMQHSASGQSVSTTPWTPTEKLLQAEVVKPFLPLNESSKSTKLSKKIIKHLKNLYPGDILYIFETLPVNNDLVWARGYTVVQPLPADFLSASVDVKKLPEPSISVSVFPMSCVKIIDKLDLKTSKNSSNLDLTVDTSYMNSTLYEDYEDYDTESDYSSFNDSEFSKIKKIPKPQLPLTNENFCNNLSDEIKLKLKTISSTLFAVYSKNNFEFFEKLSQIYYDLDDLRISLTYSLLTKSEEEIAKKQVVFLMGKFSKLLASGGGLINKSLHSKSDIDGKESILARDEETAELYQFNSSNDDIVNPAAIAQNQITMSLSPNSVTASNVNFVPPKNNKFKETIPSNIMVDFKEVVSSSTIVPKGYLGMKAYMYLRNSKKRLTEAFSINIGANQDIRLDNLAAALFTNIPAIEVESSRIYLVAVLTETIQINDNNSTLPIIRKGMCAGVADVSRIFSHRKGHLVSGQAHRFQIKLFSSFLDGQKQEVKLFAGMNQMMAKSITMVNNGWGELCDRIISGSSKGVAVNPRAEKLILSIKELKLSLGDNFNSVAWACIPTLNYNPLERDENRIYLKLNKINNKSLKLHDKSFLSVHVRSSSKSLLFAKGKNEDLLPCWRFLSVSPDESIQELISIRGLSDKPDNGKDFLIFDLYLDNDYIGAAEYLLKSGNEIYDNGIFNRVPITVDVTTVSNTVAATIEIDLEVVGKSYNRDPIGNSILGWKNTFGTNLILNEAEFIEMLSKLKRINLSTLIRFFSNFCYELISAYEQAVINNLNKLKQALFDALVHLFDATIARNQEYVGLYDKMIKEYGQYLPKVGEHLISSMALVFSSFNQNWNANGRALCRTSYLVLKICSQCIGDLHEFKNQVFSFTNSITNFLDSNIDNVLADQLLVIETLELYLDVLKSIFQPSDLIKFSVEWIYANKLKGLGSLEDSNSTALVNKKRTREHKVLISKLFFVNRILNNPNFFKSENIDYLLVASFDIVLSVLSSDIIDLDCSRLALSIYMTICKASFGKDKFFVDKSSKLYSLFIKLIPFLGKYFNKYYEYCSSQNLFKKKRTFTQLFPNTYPFVENTMDSIVTDITLVEILVDFSVVIIYSTKICDFYKITNNDLGNYNNLLNKFDIPTINSLFSIKELLSMIDKLIISSYYPSSHWLSLHSISLQGAYILLNILQSYLPKCDSETVSIWNKYISLLFKVSTAKPVSIEHLDTTPRNGCFELTTDLRTKISGIINDTWDRLGVESSKEDEARFQLNKFGGYQSKIIEMNSYKILKLIMLFSMQRNESCLNIGAKVFWTVVATELVEKDTLFDFEKESVTSLYDLFENDTVYSPSSYEIQNFILALHKIINKMDSEDEAYVEVTRLIKTLSNYLTSLSELKQVPVGEEFDDDRTFHKLNISSYLLNVDRPELFQGFICDMYENYLNKKNYVQAALSLELLANTWDWDIDTYLPECIKPKLPSQTAFKRKSELYKIIAANFAKGNKLEQAVDMYNEMLDAYLKFNFDLLGISQVHGELSKLYGELEHVDRLESTFFKIAFIGLGFPESIRGKDFIYEGLPYEHITSVHNRLTRLYPGSKIITNEDEANKLINGTNSTVGKFLFIKTVIPKKESHVGKLSVMAKQYVDNKNLNTFINTRRLPGASSITNLWTEEITYKTFMTFPTLMNRSEIKNVHVDKIPPVKNAIRSLISKNDELSNLEFLINQNLKDNISLQSISSSSVFNSISRILAGTVDSPVNGGAGQFRVFFSGDKDSSIDIGETIEEYELDADKLKKCFNELITILNRLLKLHGLIVPETLKLQHESLVELFEKNFKNEIEELKLDVDTQLDYDELMKSLTTKNVHSKNRNYNSFSSSTNTSVNQFNIPLSATASHTTSVNGRNRPHSIHSSHHGSHHGSRIGSHRSYGGLLVGGSARHSMRDDISNMGDAESTANSKSTRKNILNYK